MSDLMWVLAAVLYIAAGVAVVAASRRLFPSMWEPWYAPLTERVVTGSIVVIWPLPLTIALLFAAIGSLGWLAGDR